MTTTTWVKKKLDIDMSHKFMLSKDVGTRGAKNFATFSSLQDMVSYLNDHHNHSLYEILVSDNLPCFMYFDIDLPDSENKTAKIVVLFMETLAAYLKLAYTYDVVWAPGVNCQVSTSSTKTKCSIHFVGYIRLDSVAQHKIFNIGLIEYIIKNDIKGLLYVNKASTVACAIDQAVYSKFRSYRCLYMKKEGKTNQLTPFGTSSTKIEDHLVNFYEDHSPKPITTLHIVCVKKDVKQTSVTKRENKVLKVENKATIADNTDEYSNKMKPFIENNKDIAGILKVNSLKISSVYKKSNGDHYDFLVDRNINPICPFAQRTHRNNHIFIKCYVNKPCMYLCCYNDKCSVKGSLSLFPYTAEDIQHNASINVHPESLHAQDSVEWSQIYTEKYMKPYPNDNVVCIRAGMGVGKTVAMKEFVKQHFTPTTKSIILTFSRNLARKYANDFQSEKFVSYQDVSRTYINDSKVIVCLDSLWRVLLRNPDYIFIDEALSVFLHFNSPLMNKTSEISTLLELLVRQAKHTFYIDACIDNTFMTNVISYFYKNSQTKPTWIFNKYVRPTNKKAVIKYIPGAKATKTLSDNPIAYSAMQRVIELVDKGNKVVVCSSTKKFTIVLKAILLDKFPNKSIMIYNSDTSKEEGACIDTSIWSTLDILIYSPSITAGVSFEELHFDCLVAYLVNSPRTPSIDVALQQMFRVRQLKDGDMYIYVLEQPLVSYTPVYENEIESYLETDSSLLNKYYAATNVNYYSQQKIENDKLVYDKERLSYQILKGIITLQNRSSAFFIDTLKQTLTEDYDIPCSIDNSSDVWNDQDHALISEIENKISIEPPPFSSDFIVSLQEYDDLCYATDLTPLQQIQKRVYEIGVTLWGVDPSNIDAAFYDKYIAPNDAYDKVYMAQRCARASNHSYDEVLGEFYRKMDLVKYSCDPNMELFKSRYKTYYLKLLTGMQMLNSCFESEWKDKFSSFQNLRVHESKIEKAYNDVVGGFNANEKADFYKLYELGPKTKPFIGFKKVLSLGFGMDAERSTNNNKRPSYKDIIIDNFIMSTLDSSYSPKIFLKN